ncbi:hypothetical protein PR048_005843 [Dryococelus australis]|uniref:Uncharacterized protein n=1 Tax=Dryococelus australis TaxID=614101 RepID=A0ABQ9I9A9_9NEOP|nr:hypothetical protein PR048_005843 [Dryococelus australis]
MKERKKVMQIYSVSQEAIFKIPVSEDAVIQKKNYDEKILEQLKEKFEDCTEGSMKVKFLTILPKYWCISRIQKEFPNATNYIIGTSKKLVRENRLMASPNPNPGRNLDHNNVETFQKFYRDDSVSRMMPGKKGFITLNWRYQRTQTKDASTKQSDRVSFSKFASLRSKHILAGSSGTHTVCIYLTHQNMKLLIDGCNLTKLMEKHNLLTYHHYCPGPDNLRKSLETTFEAESH